MDRIKDLKELSRLNVLILRMKHEAIELQAYVDCFRDAGQQGSFYANALKDQLRARNYWLKKSIQHKKYIQVKGGKHVG